MSTIIGLDIDPHSLRAVIVKTALRKSSLFGYVGIPLPPVTDPEERKEQLRAAVKQVLASIGHPPDRVITELSGDEVSIRKLTLPTKVAKKLDDLLPNELDGVVPFDPAESVIDHQPIEIVGPEMKLLAAVAPKEKVRAHIDLMNSIGVDPREIAVGAVALDGLVPLLPQLTTPGPHCLIDIHYEGTDVCILKNGVCHFARTLSVGIPDIDERRQYLLERELRQTMAAWRMEGGIQPATFYICGTMATRPTSDTWLAQIVGAEVITLPLPVAPGSEEIDRPAFVRAAALAGRTLVRAKHLDARRGEFAAKETMGAIAQNLPLFAVCAAVILIAFIFSSCARLSVLESRHTQLEDELARVTQLYFGREERTKDGAMRALRQGGSSNDPMPAFDAYHALAAISEAISPSITHDVEQLQIDLGDGRENARFSMRGVVSDPAASAQIRTAIEDHRVVRRIGEQETRLACFHEVELGSTDRVGDTYRYRLEGQIQCRPEGARESDDDDDEHHENRTGGGRT